MRYQLYQRAIFLQRRKSQWRVDADFGTEPDITGRSAGQDAVCSGLHDPRGQGGIVTRKACNRDFHPHLPVLAGLQFQLAKGLELAQCAREAPWGRLHVDLHHLLTGARACVSNSDLHPDCALF